VKNSLYVETGNNSYFITGDGHRIRNLLRSGDQVDVEWFRNRPDEVYEDDFEE